MVALNPTVLGFVRHKSQSYNSLSTWNEEKEDKVDLTTLNDSVMGFQGIDLNPVASNEDPKHIYIYLCLLLWLFLIAKLKWSPEEEDCVVAVKFLEPQLSFFRPNNSEWIDIRIQNPRFFCFQCNAFQERWHVSHSWIWRPRHRIMGSPRTWQQAQVSMVAFQKNSLLHDHCQQNASGLVL